MKFELIALSQKEYTNIKIKNKEYFTCYNNPFYRFDDENKDFVWLSGLYDGDTIISNYNVEISHLDSFNRLKFSFFLNSKLKIETSFKVLSININETILELESTTFERYLNCSKNLGVYNFVESEISELYYNVDNQRLLLMTFEKK